MQPTSWEDALDLVARVTVAVINDQGEDGLFVSAFDHGGAGGGYENTWGTGKLYFGAMKIKNIRIHNRPAYNSEVHATRDMGVGRAQQLLRGRRTRRHDLRRRLQFARDPDQLLPQPLDPQSAGHLARQEESELPDEPHAGGAHRHRRSAAHGDGQCLRGRGRQGQRPSPGDQLGHRSRPVQRPPHLRRRQGMGRQGLHCRLDQRLRQGAGGQQDLDRGCREDHRPRAGGHRQGGGMDRHAEGRRQAPPRRCSPTRRA